MADVGVGNGRSLTVPPRSSPPWRRPHGLAPAPRPTAVLFVAPQCRPQRRSQHPRYATRPGLAGPPLQRVGEAGGGAASTARRPCAGRLSAQRIRLASAAGEDVAEDGQVVDDDADVAHYDMVV